MGRTLSDENTIDSYRIKEGSKLNLILAPKPELRDIMYKSFRKVSQSFFLEEYKLKCR